MPESVNTRLQLMCVWSAPVFVVVYGTFMLNVAGFVPPISPKLTPDQIAELFARDRTRIRVGQIGMLVTSTLLFPYFAVISAQIRRIELARRGNSPVLAPMQFGAGVLLVVYFQACSMIWIIASYRPDLDPELLRLLNDGAWLMFVMVFPGYVLQLLCVAIAAFSDKQADPVWPRWAGYLNLWVALGPPAGGIAVFFTSGPFAWNGLLGFYVPVGLFLIWLVAMTALMHKGIKRQTVSAAAAVRAPELLV
jgi:hypothetical protein